MNIGSRSVTPSLILRLGIAFGAIVTLAFVATVSATIFAELSTGSATAINLAGRLRAQSYQIAVRVLLDSTEGRRSSSDVSKAVAQFGKLLTSPPLVDSLPTDSSDPIRQAYNRVTSQWSNIIKPTILKAPFANVKDRDTFVLVMAGYARNIDQFVYDLEQQLEGRIQTLKVIQGVVLFVTIVVVFIALYLLHTQAIVPMSDLVQCAGRLRAGDFAARVQHTGNDELGQLGRAFNFMIAELSRSYANLEARVAEKTEQLARSNRSLELLYNTTSQLADNTLTQSALHRVAEIIERSTGLEVNAICVREPEDRCGFPIVLKGDTWRPGRDCDICFGGGQEGVRIVGEGAKRVLSIPLTEAGNLHGMMLMSLPIGFDLDEWTLKLIESVGHHIGSALAASKRAEEKGRMALMEERSVIARELHDSLAQSLSYLNIQVTRLKMQLNGEGGSEEAAAVRKTQVKEIVEELKFGLGNAYRQLRELLTTFRLGMDSRGLSEALQEAVNDFSRRTGNEFRLHNQLLGHELDSGEQIHVLQVVREALTNIEHHAHAKHADVYLTMTQGLARITIEDDGVGIPVGNPPENHYGLAIMQDRAATLGGRLRISRRPEGGTRVELEFTPRGPYQAFKLRTLTVGA